jgi:hypothetical protein
VRGNIEDNGKGLFRRMAGRLFFMRGWVKAGGKKEEVRGKR